MNSEPLTRDDLRDMLAEAISESVDLDWRPEDAAECVLARLEKEGLAIQPSLPAIAEEHRLSSITLSYYSAEPGKHEPFWSVHVHAKGVGGSETGASPEVVTDKALASLEHKLTADRSKEIARLEKRLAELRGEKVAA